MVFVFPELSTEEEEEEEEEEGDDEDGSSDEFTDSIEEDDDKVTARRLASIQVKTFSLHLTVKVWSFVTSDLCFSYRFKGALHPKIKKYIFFVRPVVLFIPPYWCIDGCQPSSQYNGSRWQ